MIPLDMDSVELFVRKVIILLPYVHSRFGQDSLLLPRACSTNARIGRQPCKVHEMNDGDDTELTHAKTPRETPQRAPGIAAHEGTEEGIRRAIYWERQLLEIARHLTESLDVKEVLTRIGIGAKEILAAHGCAIYLLSPDGRTLTPVVSIEPPYEEQIISTPIDVDSSFTGQAVKARRGLIFNDAGTDPSGHQIPGTPEEDDECVIVAPFVVDDRILGAMCLNRMGILFSEEDLALGETFATYAAMALKNAQTHQELQHEVEERKRVEKALRNAHDELEARVAKRTAELGRANEALQDEVAERTRAEASLAEAKRKIEDLHGIARRMEECAIEDELLSTAVDAAERILGLSISHVAILEQGGLETEAASSEFSTLTTNTRDVCHELAEETLRTGKTNVFSTTDELPVIIRGIADLESGISAPVGDMGVFQAFSTEPNAFTRDDVGLIELLLGHTVLALKRIRLQNELREQAIHDPLTGVYNRYYLNDVLERESKRSRRYSHSLALLMIDVDGLKEINDRFGHQIGDKALQYVASLLADEVRETDIVVRYGGDEFLVILPETGQEVEAIKNRIVEKAAESEIHESLPVPVTFSIGMAYWSQEGPESVEEVLTKVDKRMYEDKRRNWADKELD